MNTTTDNYLCLTERDAQQPEALAEKLRIMELERDFYANKVDEILERLGGVIVGIPRDKTTQDYLLSIFYGADEAKFNAFWLTHFAGK